MAHLPKDAKVLAKSGKCSSTPSLEPSKKRVMLQMTSHDARQSSANPYEPVGRVRGLNLAACMYERMIARLALPFAPFELRRTVGLKSVHHAGSFSRMVRKQQQRNVPAAAKPYDVCHSAASLKATIRAMSADRSASRCDPVFVRRFVPMSAGANKAYGNHSLHFSGGTHYGLTCSSEAGSNSCDDRGRSYTGSHRADRPYQS